MDNSYAVFVHYPTSPPSVKDAVQAVENEPSELRKVAAKLENTWEHVKSLNLFAFCCTTLQAKDPSITSALSIQCIILLAFKHNKTKTRIRNREGVEQNQKCMMKHAVDEIDPHERTLPNYRNGWSTVFE